MIKVLVADDHKIFRQGLIELLQSDKDLDFNILGGAGDGYEALAMIKKMLPDLAIIDISMPQLSGIELIEHIIKNGYGTKIIVLTMHKDPALADKAIRLGAHGFIIKDNALEDLIYAIKTIMAGGKFISPSISEDIFTFQNKPASTEIKLTAREEEVLCLIARGFTNKEIAKKLFISVKTVETHRTRIMNKLDCHKVADLVRYAIENDLLVDWNE